METKTCTKCKLELTNDMFYHDPNTGGLRARCKICLREEKQHRKKHPSQKIRSDTKLCTKCNRILPLSEFYLRADKSKSKGKETQTHRPPCKSCFSEIQRERRKVYGDKIRESSRVYRKKNRERDAEKAAIKRWELKYQVFDRLGGKCVHCGYRDYRALQVDHINGGGNADRERARGMGMWYTYILGLSDSEFFDKFQLLCANCNTIKRLEKGEVGNENSRKSRWESVKHHFGS